MVEQRTERRLAAILAADVVGYSRLLGADEAATLTRLRTLKREVVDPLLAKHGGRIFKTTGDGLLAEFPSAVQALRCAIAIQDRLRADPATLQLRIGLHQGDVVIDGDDLLGDGVNIAARIEPLAEPGGICISARVREDAAGKISIDVEDLGEPELKNIAQKVRIFRVRFNPPERPALTLPDKPSLAVLPFQNMSGDAEQEYFADGMVEDITTALSHTGWLFVIARNSAFTYKGRAVDIRLVGRELGVRYVLEGSIRRAAGRVRITCQLIEAATGHHVWAGRFDGDLADIFDLQDRITEDVVGAIEPSLQRAEITRALAKPTDSLNAYDLYLRALPQFRRMSRRGMDDAVETLLQALAIDPNYARAKALLANVYFLRFDQGWGSPGDRDAGLALVRENLAAATDDPNVLAGAGMFLAVTGDRAGALTVLDRALRLHPHNAIGLHQLGLVYLLGNDPERAIGYVEHAIRVSPLDPGIGARFGCLGIAHLMLGRNAEASSFLQRGVQETPNLKWLHRHYIHALTRLGRHEEARIAAGRLLEIDPDHRVGPLSTTYYSRELNEERHQALLAAGIPD